MRTELVKENAVYEDLYHIPENMTGEIIDGGLYVFPRPAPKHISAASVLGIEIGPPYHLGKNGPGGWWIFDEPEIHFSDLKKDVVVPDLAGWKRERMPMLPKESYFSISPDWICEVLSPKTAIHDKKRKLPKYAKFGVSFVWLISPTDQTVEILKLQGDKYSILDVFSEDDKMRAEPFTAVEIDLKNLWSGVEQEE